MNGNNSQTKEGFIKALNHPRKKELATIMINAGSPEAAIAAAEEAGADRITIMEMGREIRRSVAGMEDFRIKMARRVVEGGEATEDSNVVVAEETPAAPVADQTPAADQAPVADQVADQTIVGADPAAPVADQAVETEVVATPENTAPVADETAAAPVPPVAPEVTAPTA